MLTRAERIQSAINLGRNTFDIPSDFDTATLLEGLGASDAAIATADAPPQLDRCPLSGSFCW
jgi:hypothetical protein